MAEQSILADCDRRTIFFINACLSAGTPIRTSMTQLRDRISPLRCPKSQNTGCFAVVVETNELHRGIPSKEGSKERRKSRHRVRRSYVPANRRSSGPALSAAAPIAPLGSPNLLFLRSTRRRACVEARFSAP
jgi:hypothetical protein